MVQNTIIIDQKILSNFDIILINSAYYGHNYAYSFYDVFMNYTDHVQILLKHTEFTDVFKNRYDLSEEHIKLIRELKISEDVNGYICIDQKKPFGNSNYINDIKKVFTDKNDSECLEIFKIILNAFSHILDKNSYKLKYNIFSYNFDTYSFEPNIKLSRKYKLKKLLK